MNVNHVNIVRQINEMYPLRSEVSPADFRWSTWRSDRGNEQPCREDGTERATWIQSNIPTHLESLI